MRLGALLAALALIGCVAGGCVSTAHPVDSPPGAHVDAGPYTGEWIVDEVGGAEFEAVTNVEIIQEPGGSLKGVVASDSQTVTGTLELTDIGGMTVASFSPDQYDGWVQIRATLNVSETHLGLSLIDTTLMEEAVSTGALSGTVDALDSDLRLVQIESSGADLRSFYSTHPHVFEPESSLTLERGGSGQTAQSATDVRLARFEGQASRKAVSLMVLVVAVSVFAVALQAAHRKPNRSQ